MNDMPLSISIIYIYIYIFVNKQSHGYLDKLFCVFFLLFMNMDLLTRLSVWCCIKKNIKQKKLSLVIMINQKIDVFENKNYICQVINFLNPHNF